MTISKLQSEAVKELDSKFYGAILWDKMTGKKPTYIRGKIKKLITDQIQKAYKAGIKEVLRNVEYNAQTKIWDIPEEKLLSIQSKGNMK